MKKDCPFILAQFIASAFKPEEMPKMLKANGHPMPEIAIVGRSNVGKSSLINHLLNNSKLAKTSSTPGKTQSINFFAVDEQIALVDLPGYGYAKVPKAVKKIWAGFIDLYLKKRATLQLILLLLDSRRDPTEEDYALIKWAAFHQKPLLLIFTKSDKLSDREKREKMSTSLDFMKNAFPAAPLHFLYYSIKDPNARIELTAKINALLKEHGTHQ